MAPRSLQEDEGVVSGLLGPDTPPTQPFRERAPSPRGTGPIRVFDPNTLHIRVNGEDWKIPVQAPDRLRFNLRLGKLAVREEGFRFVLLQEGEASRIVISACWDASGGRARIDAHMIARALDDFAVARAESWAARRLNAWARDGAIAVAVAADHNRTVHEKLELYFDGITETGGISYASEAESGLRGVLTLPVVSLEGTDLEAAKSFTASCGIASLLACTSVLLFDPNPFPFQRP